MPGRILIIRGGAIGDFILTLPAIGLLRQNLPEARIEILGYPAITQLALSPEYADAVHSIEYAPLARFFSRRPKLDPEMVAFFTGFQQIISYLYDPDGIFAQNLQTAGVKNLLQGSGRLGDDLHAVYQLARPLEQLAFFLEDPAAHFVANTEDNHAAENALSEFIDPFVALHPGSGSKKKNWPLEKWSRLISLLLELKLPVLLIGGEADHENLTQLKRQFDLPTAENLPLRTLGAILAKCRWFVGHDSGISHLAAAAGARCLLLFGSTDPDIWAPLNPGVEVISSSDATLELIDFEQVAQKIRQFSGC